MKIAVVGAGAMGSLFGALLSEGGNQVWLYDIWPEHIRAVVAAGLRIEREGQTRTVWIKATTDPQVIGRAELVIIFVKSTHTRPAAETARDLAGDRGAVMTLQNGMGNADIIAELIDPARILAGTTSHGATMLGAGSIRHAGIGPTTIGVWAESTAGFECACKVAHLFTQAGIATETVEDIRRVVWDKLLINIGINAITALTGIKNGQLLDLESTRAISRTAVKEALGVAQAAGIAVHDDVVERVFRVAEATAANRSSMGQDVDNRRPTEIHTINGYIVRQAEKHGMDVPVNRTLTALIETMQFHF